VPADLEEYRREADAFLSALYEEYYLQLSGQKADLVLGPIYERYADLTSETACRELAEAAAGGDGRAVELWRFAYEGLAGRRTATEEERLAELETTLEAELDGELIGYRELRPALANEPDRERRARLERARAALVEEVDPLYREMLDRTREAAAEMGAGSVRELYVRFGVPLDELAADCEAFLDRTRELHASAFDALLRDRLGIGLGDARRHDIPRLIRSEHWDDAFPAARMLPALEATLADLGVVLAAQGNVELDVAARPAKDPRAFCAPIDVPRRVVLSIKPMGGIDDWRALFHEAGHLEHFAHTSPRLPFEARRLGDSAVTECWAFLLEHLVSDPAWLARRLDVGRIDELVAESATVLLYSVRRYCGKLLYELDLHSGASDADLPALYAERLRDATLVDWPPTDYLLDVDAGFYVASYLRAWALEAQVAAALRSQFGTAWFATRKAGDLLRELWHEGQGMDADELAREVAGAELTLDALADELERAL
jgi:hypothetical protein